MAFKIERVDTWAASLEDKPGSLATKLNTLASAGVNLEFIIARRTPERTGSGVVFATPIKGSAGCSAARKAGFEKTENLYTVRIEGPDKPGQGTKLVQVLAEKGLNLRGFSAAAIGTKFVAYLALDTSEDVVKAMRVLKGLE
jgi:hypothetical protein